MKKAISNNTNKLRLFVVLVTFLALVSASIIIVSQVKNSKTNISAISQFGSRGEEVRQVQTKLKNAGFYNGAIDGVFGSATQSAVRNFQRSKGLTVDGIAGSKTLSALGVSSSTSQGQYSSNDVYLLAKVIAAEARGEPYTGQVAVGAVILNRVEHSSFPDSIAGVVYQSGAFSCVNDSNWSEEPNDSSKKAAQAAINGWDPSGGAIYYYNPKKTSNQWMRTRPVIVTIGDHLFCS